MGRSSTIGDRKEFGLVMCPDPVSRETSELSDKEPGEGSSRETVNWESGGLSYVEG